MSNNIKIAVQIKHVLGYYTITPVDPNVEDHTMVTQEFFYQYGKAMEVFNAVQLQCAELRNEEANA